MKYGNSNSAPRPPRVLVTGGGTGGHIYPGLAVAEALIELVPDCEVRFAGTGRGLEAILVPRAGHRFYRVPASGLRGLGALARILFLGNFLLGWLRGLVLILTWRPDAVLGTGGYVIAPVMAAARTLGVPCVLQEQNAVPGSANRLVGRWARRIYLGFAAAERFFRPGICRDTGNPVRLSFLAGPPGEESMDAPQGVRSLLIFGGSGGARTLNRAAGDAATWFEHEDLALWIQTGRADHEEVRERFAGHPPHRVRVVPYIEDMPAALDWADLVVCRAGAMTLAELQAVGRPAVLVPFPFATDDHQLRNAQECRDAGSAVVLRDDLCDAVRLTEVVAELLADPERLAVMGAAAKARSRPNAAAVIAADLLQMIGHAAGREAPRTAGAESTRED